MFWDEGGIDGSTLEFHDCSLLKIAKALTGSFVPVLVLLSFFLSGLSMYDAGRELVGGS